MKRCQINALQEKLFFESKKINNKARDKYKDKRNMVENEEDEH